MRSMTFLVLLAVIAAGIPSSAWTATPALSPAEKAEMAAIAQPKLLLQSAGDGVLIVDNRRGWRRHSVYISTGAIILTAVIVTLVVLGGAPSRRGY